MESAMFRRVRVVSVSLMVSLNAALTGCITFGPDFRQPVVTLEEQRFESLPGDVPSAPAAQAAWWTAFDPVLTALEQRAYERNLTLQVAGLHIFEARATRDQRTESAAAVGHRAGGREPYRHERRRPDSAGASIGRASACECGANIAGRERQRTSWCGGQV
jgi:outer membrane protein TolC